MQVKSKGFNGSGKINEAANASFSKNTILKIK